VSDQIVGIIGGIGPESTIDYYRSIIDVYRKRANGDSPAIVITSLDVDRLVGWFTAKRLDDVVGYIGDELDRLHDAGATFAILAANTPHLVFDRLQARAKLPILSIVEAVGDVAARNGATRLGLLGTRFTMEAPFYPEVLARRSITVVRPAADEITWVHERYIGELLKNEFKPETRDGIKQIVDRLRREDGIEGLIYGGTELPLLMRDVPIGLPTIDSTLVHVDAIVSRLLGE
jgi:aspartate racemase